MNDPNSVAIQKSLIFYREQQRMRNVGEYEPPRSGFGGLQFRNPFVNIPVGAKVVSGILVFGYFGSLIIPGFADFFCLNPSNTISRHFHLWSLVTAAYVEPSFFGVLVSSLVVLLIGKWLLPVWGRREFITFVVLVNFVSVVSLFFVLTMVYLCSGSETVWFADYGGFAAALGGFSVVMKQLTPDAEFQIFLMVPLRAKHLPVLVGSLSLVLLILFGLGTGSSLLALFGIIVGWLYLRYIQQHSDELRGDASDEFSFASMFPPPLQPFVARVVNLFKNAADRLGIGRLAEQYVFVSLNRRTNLADGLVGSSPVPLGVSSYTRSGDRSATGESSPEEMDDGDRERRRARGLRAVDIHMQETVTGDEGGNS